jgi:hypothetical protein
MRKLWIKMNLNEPKSMSKGKFSAIYFYTHLYVAILIAY